MRRPATMITTLVVAALVSLSGCGQATTPAGPVSPSLLATQLTVRYDDGGGTASTWTLTCDPAGGDHPKPQAACAALAAHGRSALPAPKAGNLCTEIYGGPQRAVITGRWQGEAVDATLSRTNGCEIARWSDLEGLVPETG